MFGNSPFSGGFPGRATLPSQAQVPTQFPGQTQPTMPQTVPQQWYQNAAWFGQPNFFGNAPWENFQPGQRLEFNNQMQNQWQNRQMPWMNTMFQGQGSMPWQGTSLGQGSMPWAQSGMPWQR